MDTTLIEMKRILGEHKESWKNIYKVEDVTIGLKQKSGKIVEPHILCFRFWTKIKLTPDSLALLTAPETIEKEISGYPTDVVIDEMFYAPEKPQYTTEIAKPLSNEGINRLRPVKMGASICNITGTAGTTGAMYYKSGQYFILTNAHVGAEDPFLYVGQQEVRNVQPGPYHNGTYPNDFIQNMRYMVLLNNQNSETTIDMSLINVYKETEDGTIFLPQESPNTCDCCLIGPLSNPEEVVSTIIDMPNAPNVSAYVVKPGDKVMLSSWRMDGVSEGLVTDIGKSSQVQYGNGKVALFVDQILITKFGEPGTSGSGILCILDDGKKAFIGLNFAGNDSMNIVCPIQHIDTAFGGVVVVVGEEPQPPEGKEYTVTIHMKKITSNNWLVKCNVLDIDGDLPLSHASVNLDGGDSLYTDDIGQVEFSNVVNGKHIVHVEKDGYEAVSGEFILEDTNGQITSYGWPFDNWFKAAKRMSSTK